MTRFHSTLVVVLLAGCAGPAPADRAPVRAGEPLTNAFSVDAAALAAAPEAWRQKIDPTELLGEDFQDFPGPRLLPEEEAPRDPDPAQAVVSILRDFVAPGKWNTDGLSIQDGTLFARQPPGLLSAFQSALQTMRDHRQRMIRTRVRRYELRPDALERFENIPPVAGGLVGIFEQKSLEGTLKDADGHAVPSAPLALTTFHGQRSHVFFLSQKAFVAGFGEAGSTDPRLAIASEGFLMDLRSIANGGRADEFLVSFNVQMTGPAEVVDVRLGSGVVQMPAQGYAKLSGACALRSDQTLLIVMRHPNVCKLDRPILAISVTLDWE